MRQITLLWSLEPGSNHLTFRQATQSNMAVKWNTCEQSLWGVGIKLNVKNYITTLQHDMRIVGVINPLCQATKRHLNNN